MKQYLIRWLWGYDSFRKMVMDCVVTVRTDEQISSIESAVELIVISSVKDYNLTLGVPAFFCDEYVKKHQRLYKKIIKTKLRPILEGWKPVGRNNGRTNRIL